MQIAEEARDTPSADPECAVDVSVIIPVFNDPDGIRLCIEAIGAQLFPSTRFEIIVVDNGPLEGASERVRMLLQLLERFPHAKAINEPKSGSYAARNCGLGMAKGDVLAFTDADCLPEPSWLETGVAYLRLHPEAAALVGAVRLFVRDPRAPTAAELYELRHGFRQETYVRLGYGATANLVARRSAFDIVGPFDGELQSGGDKEWGLRLTRGGLKLDYSGDVVVRHPARRTLKEIRIKARRVVSGDVRLRKKDGWRRINWLRYSFQPLRPPVRTIWRARKDPTFASLSQLCRYSAMFIVTGWITSAYRLRRLTRWVE